MSAQYTDEKHPEVVYEVIPVIEEVQVKRKRPLWRRIVRVLLTFVAISMLWSTFAPVVHHNCGRMGNRHHGLHHHRPSHDTLPPTDEKLNFESDRPLQHYTFPAGLTKFWLHQRSFTGPTRTQVFGKVVVFSCPKAENISAHFKFDGTDDDILDKIEINAHKNGIEFKLDPFSLAAQKVNATVFLVIPKKDDYKLEKVHIGTIDLNVHLTDSFTTPVNRTYIDTVSGHVSSRGKGDELADINNLKIKTVSGSIHGYFPLENALALETTSGDIKVKLASEKLPEHIGWFKTETVSGATHAVFDGNLNPRPLYSKHISVNGDINVFYPEDWQGGLKLETTSGALDVVGRGTKIIKKEKSLTKKLWEVTKGEGKSKGYIGTVSGAINVAFPEDEE